MNLQPDRAGIYYLLNTANNRMYIGQSVSMVQRVIGHVRQLAQNRHLNISLQTDWNACAGLTFEVGVLVEFKKLVTEQELRRLEDIFIHAYQSGQPEFGYNRRPNSPKDRRFIVA